ncbi:MAG: zinc-binding dehydrogenase [Verrucomicrobia bacterium]|nr:zinc-binding dehydrogenase [Verrucomicrobiota bacterium]
MRAVGVIPGKRELRLLEHAMPQITGAYDVKIRALDVGICGTDKEICTFVYGSPPNGSEYLVLGHESLGQVVEVGAGVSVFQPGDLVVPSVRRPCPHTHCGPCQADLQDFCFTGDFTERGIKMTHGFMTEYYVEEEKHLTHVPPELRDVAVLVEPLTVAEKALAQVWKVQERLPWINRAAASPGAGLRAVVLGAGPVGILGAMVLVVNGFETYVYSRSTAPNQKAELIEAIGAKYISSQVETPEQLAERVGNIDLVYEAVGVARISFEVLKVLGTNGIFVFTGIPAPKPPMDTYADEIMRNLVLRNQVVVGTVNADRAAFQAAIRDLGTFMYRWPAALRSLITGRYSIESYKDLLLGDRAGIKNVIALD